MVDTVATVLSLILHTKYSNINISHDKLSFPWALVTQLMVATGEWMINIITRGIMLLRQ